MVAMAALNVLKNCKYKALWFSKILVVKTLVIIQPECHRPAIKSPGDELVKQLPKILPHVTDKM